MAGRNIEIRGARENNLRGVDLAIPKHEITIFTGVSGSGKSSIVFDTIATEAQRQLYENFSLFVRNFLPRYPPPDADAIENLSMAVIVDQKRLGGGSHSTVGTITDIYTVLRLLFSRVGKPHAGYANAFSFNDPQGMCPECNGLGRKLGVNADELPRHVQVARTRARCRSRCSPTWENSVYAASRLLRQRQEAVEVHQGGDGPAAPRQGRASSRRSSAASTINVTLHGHHREVRARVHQARHQDAVASARRRRSSRT